MELPLALGKAIAGDVKVEFQPNHPKKGWLKWNLMTA